MRRGVILVLLLLLGCLAALVSGDCSGTRSADSLESPEWFLNGLPSPSSATIQQLTDSIILPFVRDRLDYWMNPDTLHWRVDTVGTLAGHTVVDIFGIVMCRDWEDSTMLYEHKAVKAIGVCTSSGEFRLVYAEACGPLDIYFDSSRIAKLGGTEVLYTRSRLGGQMESYDEAYWVWDSERNVPVGLDLGVAVGGAFSRFTPPPNAGWWGRFDVESLTMTGWTCRDTGEWRNPSGGTLSIKFEIKSGRLVAERARFDFANINPDESWRYKNAADSAYLLQAARTYVLLPDSENVPPDRWLYYDLLHGYRISPAASTLDSLTSAVVREATVRSSGRRLESDSVPDTKEIGSLHGHKLLQVDYHFASATCTRETGRAVAAETQPSKYRLISVDELVSYLWARQETRIICINHDSLIGTQKKEGNPGRLYYSYWLWDDDRDIPVSLYQQWVLDETLSLLAPRHLPRGLSARLHLGKWDFEKLSYDTYTWRASDKNDHPTGGKLHIQFGVRDKRLQPVEFAYNPADTLCVGKR